MPTLPESKLVDQEENKNTSEIYGLTRFTQKHAVSYTFTILRFQISKRLETSLVNLACPGVAPKPRMAKYIRSERHGNIPNGPKTVETD